MTYNYHRRLVGYMHEDPLPSRRSQSQYPYLTSANLILSSQKQRTKQLSNNILKTRNNICEKCSEKSEKNANTASRLQNARNRKEYDNVASVNEYFGSEIKTIRKTLVDIHQQIKNGGKGKEVEERGKKIKDEERQNNNNMGNRNIKYNEYYLDKQLQLKNKIEELKQININLNKQINKLIQNKQILQNKINNYSLQLQKCYQNIKYIQYNKNVQQQKQILLENQILNLKQQIIKNQQIRREINYKNQQNNQKKLTNLSITKQFNVMINWKKEDQNRGSQTLLTDVDIQKQYKQVNQMQDHLCDRINGNLKIEKKIFARIAQISDKVRYIYDKLYQLQDSVLKMEVTV